MAETGVWGKTPAQPGTILMTQPRDLSLYRVKHCVPVKLIYIEKELGYM